MKQINTWGEFAKRYGFKVPKLTRRQEQKLREHYDNMNKLISLGTVSGASDITLDQIQEAARLLKR